MQKKTLVGDGEVIQGRTLSIQGSITKPAITKFNSGGERKCIPQNCVNREKRELGL